MNTSEKRFYLDSNGVTIKCINAVSGDKGFVDGIEYECVDNELLRERIKEGSDVTRLCTSLVSDMYELFKYRNFNEPIGNWDTENVIDMDRMFENSLFNQPIGTWNTNNVKSMESMFRDSQFNQDISHWCVRSIGSEPHLFSNDSPLIEENYPKWGTCPD